MRPEKVAYVEQMRDELSKAQYMILVDYQGLTVAQTESLRNQLNAVQARLRIVKNRMLRHVTRELNYDVDAHLSGPSAMVVGQGDIVDVARTLKKFIKENKLLTIKAGVMDRKAVTSKDVDTLAELPSLDVMRGILVGTLAAPMTRLVGVFSQKLASLVYVLQAVVDKKEGK